MMSAHEGFNQRQRYGSCFFNHHQVGVAYALRIVGVHILDELVVLLVNLYPYYGLILLLLLALDLGEVQPIFVAQDLETQADELEKCFKILRRRSGNKNTAEAKSNSSS